MLVELRPRSPYQCGTVVEALGIEGAPPRHLAVVIDELKSVIDEVIGECRNVFANAPFLLVRLRGQVIVQRVEEVVPSSSSELVSDFQYHLPSALIGHRGLMTFQRGSRGAFFLIALR